MSNHNHGTRRNQTGGSGRNSDPNEERMRILEELTRNLGQVVQNQVANQHLGDLRATIANKLANLKPPIFVGLEEPTILENWIRDFEKLFTTTGTPENQKVDQATFYLRELADDWWETQGPVLRAQPGFGWQTFKEAIRSKFYPDHLRRQKYNEFTHLTQGNLSVQDYAKKFNELARFAPNLVPTEKARAEKFEDGLNFDILLNMGGGGFETYQETYNKACNVYRVKQRREEVNRRRRGRDFEDNPQDQGFKKQRGNQGGNFNHSGNRGGNYHNGNRGGNQNFGRNYNQNQNPTTYVCKRCNKSHHGQTCDGKPIVCYNCGNPGHKVFQCPNKKDKEGGSNSGNAYYHGKNGNGGSNGQGNNGNYNKQQNGGNHSNGNGNGNGHNNGNGNGNNGNGANGRIFVMSANEAAANDNVVTGTFLVNSIPAYVLFDSGASDSFISTSFVTKHKTLSPTSCESRIVVPSGKVVDCSTIFNNVPITIANTNFSANLIQFDQLIDFDVVLGMDWLKRYDAKFECRSQKIILRGKKGRKVTYRGISDKPKVRLISCMAMQGYMRRGYDVMLCHVKDVSKEEPKLSEIPVARDYSDVFPEEITEMPPRREVEFKIDLEPGTKPISKAPYRMAPAEMQELKV